MNFGTFRFAALAPALALAVGSSYALTEDETPQVPVGGYGNASGTSSGLGATDTVADFTMDTVEVTGKRSDRPSTLAPTFVVRVPYQGPPVPPPTVGGGGGAPTPEQQQACINSCDQQQKIAKDLCDVMAAKAAASGTTSAIGIGFLAGAVLTWKGGIRVGVPAGFGAYLVARELAKDHAATMNAACIGKAAEAHTNCVRGTCKFTG